MAEHWQYFAVILSERRGVFEGGDGAGSAGSLGWGGRSGPGGTGKARRFGELEEDGFGIDLEYGGDLDPFPMEGLEVDPFLWAEGLGRGLEVGAPDLQDVPGFGGLLSSPFKG
jgi:hypothetical protein